jgi:hypothetical protein
MATDWTAWSLYVVDISTLSRTAETQAFYWMRVTSPENTVKLS